MWMLPILHRVSALAVHAFYRLTVTGESVPEEGPVLLVGNHPNSLFDPALVAVAARRPVRFLAKAPLFTDRAIGWMVRGAAAIPVYRPSDDPTLVGRNEDSFRAAYGELAAGAAVGIFPEGISHSEPSLAPLKTGAARIALGAAALRGATFPIIPIGLVLREKERFRSEALVVVGAAVPWDDLLPATGAVEAAAVRELTARIYNAMRRITLNFEKWEDAPLVEGAVAIYAAEFGGENDAARRMSYVQEVAETLARLRREGDREWEPLADEVYRHLERLEALGLRPASVKALPATSRAARWTVRQLAFFLVTGALAALGALVFYLPYRLLGFGVEKMEPTPDLRATYQTLGGALFFLLWIALLAGAGALLAGAWTRVALLLGLPLLGAITVLVRDRWRFARSDARRFLLLRTRAGLRRELAERQQEIAHQLRTLREEIRA